MSQWLLTYLFIWVIAEVYSGVSSKLDFDDETNSGTVTRNSSLAGDEDVEVKHTIVVSTKLKNNNRRGIHASNDGDSGIIMQGRSQKAKKDDSGEVPVFRGYKAVETTQIRTPDTRIKTKIYPDAVFINRNIGDEMDIYPNIGNTQWKPSTFYNNINYWSPDDRIVSYNIDRKPDRSPGYRGTGKFHRKITDDGMKEFYCCKCRELMRGSRDIQQRISYDYETTTKVKIDGKLAKLN